MALKLTLLELVQDMLTAVNGENVNSVGDTEEAAMCVNIANRQFEKMSAKNRWKHFKEYTSSLQTTSNLNEMNLPTGAFAFKPDTIYYDGNPVWYLTPEVFLNMVVARDSSTDSSILTINGIPVYKTKTPVYFTSDDDELLRFDGCVDSTNGLDGSKFKAIVYSTSTSRLSADSEVFDLPAQAFPTLGEYCIAYAIKELTSDEESFRSQLREAKTSAAALARNARLVDQPDDWRKNITPRRTRGTTTTRRKLT